MRANQKDWSCPKKQRARWETIISQYRSRFGHSLPADKQYWTMSGQCATSEGKPLKGCEVAQIIEQGLIVPRQFHGVEREPDIHRLNVQAFPDLNWHNDDFYRAMTRAASEGWFNPGIVNADLIQTPESGAAFIGKILAMLTETADDCLVVANFVLRLRYYGRKDGDYVLRRLNEQPQFRFAMSCGWEMAQDYFEYNGAGPTGSRCYMGSFIFARKTRAEAA